MPKKYIGDNRGSIMLEFCLVCMLIIIVWAGMCNIALILKDRLTVVVTAREVGRYYAAIEQSESGARGKGFKILESSGIDRDRAKINIYRNDPQDNLVRSEVICQVPVAMPGASALLGGDAWQNYITVRESAVFRLEN